MSHADNTSSMQPRRFYDCTLNEKLLYTAFLVIVGIAYLMALSYLYTEFQDIDGKSGLSVEDIAENYYGNRSGSRLESALRGSMASYIDTDQRSLVILWLQTGASEQDYDNAVESIIQQKCVMCHNENTNLSLSTYQNLKQLTNIDTGVSLHSLMKVSHIHLFGIALVALGIGLIFRFALLPSWLQISLTLTPFLAVIADISAWFLTKWDPVYAYTVVIAGGLLGITWAMQIVISLYQIWRLQR